MYWKDRFENYFWGATMWQYDGFFDIYSQFNYAKSTLNKKFVANNKSYNIERAKELSKTIQNSMNLEKYLYKYCLSYY